MRALAPFFLTIAIASPAVAKPLITSSEETLARICLAEAQAPDRLVEACTGALGEAGLTTAQRLDLLTSLGNALSWSDRDDEAVEAFNDALAITPTHADALSGLGWALRGLNDDAAAFEAFEASLTSDVSSSALAGKAGTGRFIGALDEDEARLLLEAALSISPTYAWARRELAWSYFDTADYDTAIEMFNIVLRQDPTDLNARYGIGRSLLDAGQGEAALAEFNRTLEDAPDYYHARLFKIITLRALERNAQALREADRLIEDEPDRAGGYTEKGRALMGLQRRAEALEVFANAERIVGPDNALLYWHADALIDENRLSDALGVITRATALDNADSADHLLRSFILLEMQDYPASRVAAEASLKLGGNSAWAHYYIAIADVHGGDVTEGLARFDTAMQTGLPQHRVGAFASELIAAGKFVEAVQLRLKY